jgi:hypothetical protein
LIVVDAEAPLMLNVKVDTGNTCKIVCTILRCIYNELGGCGYTTYATLTKKQIVHVIITNAGCQTCKLMT